MDTTFCVLLVSRNIVAINYKGLNMEAYGMIYYETPDGEAHCKCGSCHSFYDSLRTLEAHFNTSKHKYPEGSVFIGAEIWVNN